MTGSRSGPGVVGTLVGLTAPGWSRRTLGLVVVLVGLSPAFAWAAAAVGYTEPLGALAAATGATDHATRVVPGLLPDYGVPGLGPYAGTLVAGAVGTAVTLAAALAVGELLADPSA